MEENTFPFFSPLGYWRAGFSDSVNPGAWAGLVFFLFILILCYRKPLFLLISGICFTGTVLVAIVWIGLGGWAEFFNSNHFLSLTRIGFLSVGVFSIFLGGVNFFDWWTCQREGGQNGERCILKIAGSSPKAMQSTIGSLRKQAIVQTILGAISFGGLMILTGFGFSILGSVFAPQGYMLAMVYALVNEKLFIPAVMAMIIYGLGYVFLLFASFLGTFLFSRYQMRPGKAILRPSIIKILFSAAFLALGTSFIYLFA